MKNGILFLHPDGLWAWGEAVAGESAQELSGTSRRVNARWAIKSNCILGGFELPTHGRTGYDWPDRRTREYGRRLAAISRQIQRNRCGLFTMGVVSPNPAGGLADPAAGKALSGVRYALPASACITHPSSVASARNLSSLSSGKKRRRAGASIVNPTTPAC